ncbi:hypothetical protein CEE36_08450 [candidate division TA06 bacterium B3_TA06]|uniref:Uncharacterized protein n=1 Tax=candidate division TA06 bacterium B3_TA06 TaxID=2012487 RepID=A0A532V299_UNCT6|nr:MAG: hypothetical protein CEE36_08450 [candidate division TA06 bacterium B3_TA06]
MSNTQAGKDSEAKIRKAYNELIKTLQLETVRLHTGKAAFVAKFPPSPGEDLPLSLERSAEYKPTEKGFTVRHTYKLGVVKGESGKHYARIECSFIVEYRSEKPMTDELFEIFEKVNLPLNTWPYFREFVQNSTVRMGLPPLVLPVFQVFR